ncbi:MAG: PEP-CTERM-box response regulator transcription factor [Rhodospirillaceae bacterium]|nr:MAG: PEP-CTERM-box response regulator transcription factor [Rhodospirillaceae bacterium]
MTKAPVQGGDQIDELPLLLLVEDDPGLQRQMGWALADAFTVITAGDRVTGLEHLAQHKPRVAVIDLGLPPDPNGASEGLLLLETIVSKYPGIKVIVASGNEERANARRAVSLGAYDFFAKPVDIDELRLILMRALRFQYLEEENRRLSRVVHSPLEGIVAASPAMLAVCDTIRRVAVADISVMILGESGTGKELIARAIHQLSHRADGPFVATNCAAIPDNLLESELFGYERGAFTGAHAKTIGRIESAAGGTLFLDEIGDMPLPLQAKLLRFLQDRTFQRLGSHRDITVDLRIVSATNRNLQNMIREGTFREDLFFRINEISVALPPLRERAEDGIMIAQVLVRRYAEVYNRRNAGFSNSALAAISNHSWPGNVRELENRVKRAVLMGSSDQLSAQDLGLGEADGELAFPTLKDVRNRAELEIIRKVLTSCQNNLSQAAKILGVSRPTLYNLMASHGIKLNGIAE